MFILLIDIMTTGERNNEAPGVHKWLHLITIKTLTVITHCIPQSPDGQYKSLHFQPANSNQSSLIDNLGDELPGTFSTHL